MCFFMFFDFSYSPFEGFCLLLSMIIFGKLWIFLKWFCIAIFPGWLSGLILYLYKSKAWPRAM